MFGLSFLTPAFLFGALAVAVPIVLHLLRRETLPRVPFSAVRFLRQRVPEQARRQRLRELLLLALRVAALLLLAAAFARPFLADAAGPGRPATVVLVDTSFSVSAPSQVATLRGQALAAIDAAPADHLVGVVAFDDEARVVAPLEATRGEARAAVRGLEARPRATRYGEGLALASALVGTREGQLVLVTDRQASGWRAGAEGVPTRLEIAVREVGPPESNLAVLRVDPERAAVTAVLLGTGAATEATRVSLALDGEVVSTQDVAPGVGRTTVRFPVTPPSSGVATVSVIDPVGYPADDSRHRLLGPPDRPVVVLVGAERRRQESLVFVERALAPADLDGPYRVDRVAAADLGDAGTELGHVGAAVLLGADGLDRAGREQLATFVRGGGGLLVVAGPAVDPAMVADLFDAELGLRLGEARAHAEPLSLASTASRHPITTALGALAGALGQARFDRTVALASDAGAVARFSDGSPALVERSVGDGRVLVFASDLGAVWNDLPRRPVFLPWLHETLTYLVSREPAPREFLVGDAPSGVPQQPGVATFVDDGRPERRVVVNVDVAESDPARLSQAAFDAELRRPASTLPAGEPVEPPDEGRRFWRYLLMGVAVLLVGEALLARRTP